MVGAGVVVGAGGVVGPGVVVGPVVDCGMQINFIYSQNWQHWETCMKELRMQIC